MDDCRFFAKAPCFFESNPAIPLLRRAFVEAIGTFLLVLILVGSGLAVSRQSPVIPLVANLTIAISVAGALVGLIVAFGKVSGGHFNPLITIAQWLSRERSATCTAAYVVAQCCGGALGAIVAGSTILVPPDAGPAATTTAFMLSEVIASAGLLSIVLGCAKSAKWETGPFGVGLWLVAAIVATPSGSYANPAVTIAVVLAKGPTSLATSTALLYVLAQLIGLLIAIVVNRIAFAPD